MRPLTVLAAVVAALALLLPAGGAAGQVPPGPTTVSDQRFEAAGVPGPIDLVQVVLDFPPGAGAPTHTHGGQAFITILEGALTLSAGGAETTYRAGATLVEQPGEFYAAINPTSGNTRVVATYVLPQGAPLTAVREGAAAPAVAASTVAQGRVEIAAPPPQFDVVQLLLDFPPGAWTPPHTHGGPALVTVLEGQVTERRPGLERRFGAGEGWSEPAGELHAAGNDGAAPARLAATILLERGAELTTAQTATQGPAPAAAQPAATPARPVAAPSGQIPGRLPRTGERPAGAIPGLLAALALLAGGLRLRRPRGSRHQRIRDRRQRRRLLRRRARRLRGPCRRGRRRVWRPPARRGRRQGPAPGASPPPGSTLAARSPSATRCASRSPARARAA